MKKKTFISKVGDIKREWLLVDAADKTLGRLCSQIAMRLRGKHKPYFSEHMLCGDYVVVVNCEKIKVTGRKAEDKEYQKYTGYHDGRKVKKFNEMLQNDPQEIIRHAVKGMLPKNSLAKEMMNSLKIYSGADHPHAAQNPKEVVL